MSESDVPTLGSWVPSSCTLPTADQPLRLAEFDELFASSVTAVERTAPGLRLILVPEPETAARVADLVVREAQCCSMFTFTLTAGGGEVFLDVTAPADRGDIVEAIAVRAETARS